MSKTEDNLQTAIAAESLARNKYTRYAEVARKEGFPYIAKIFEEIADNEKYHAMQELSLLAGDSSTAENLRNAIRSEKEEFERIYPRFAVEAEIEGNRKAEVLFRQISKIEEQHHNRFERLLDLVETGSVFERESPIRWKCSICGYAHEGLRPPNRCPYCRRPQKYYEPANMDV